MRTEAQAGWLAMPTYRVRPEDTARLSAWAVSSREVLESGTWTSRRSR